MSRQTRWQLLIAHDGMGPLPGGVASCAKTLLFASNAGRDPVGNGASVSVFARSRSIIDASSMIIAG
jgi:hypothetical protein